LACSSKLPCPSLLAIVYRSPTNRGVEHRLHDAVTQLSAEDGYGSLTVKRLLAVAGVSRASFYQHFLNVDDCFQSAYRLHVEALVSELTPAIGRSEHPELAMLDALVDLATSDPDVARLVMTEGLASGQTGLAQRDALIAAIERALHDVGGQRSAVDVPLGLLIGGMFRFLSMRLSDGGIPRTAREDMRAWVKAFTPGSSRASWGAALFPAFRPRGPRPPEQPIDIPPGGTVRERILRATAAAVHEKGYRDVTVGDIAATAGVSRRGFYNEFDSRSDAFIATYEQGFEKVLAACIPGFFSSTAWPERVWHGAQAFAGFMAREPLIAYLGFVECYAIGPRFVQRVHDTQLAFTLFLEEGYRQRPEASSLSRAHSALTVATIFEAGFQAVRFGPSLHIRGMQPLAVYLALAPFLGADEAGGFVIGKLRASQAGAPAA
jgi:AcrR family transcriptional regulator